MKTIVTHNSGYHADDIFAVATLLLIETDAKIVRTRDKSIIATGDYVVDVGFEYDPARLRFDHHQPGGAGQRDNGIQYASFGLVWRHFGKQLAGGERESEIIDERLGLPLDAHDNGQPIAEYLYEGVREYTISDFFHSYILEPKESEENLYKFFINNVAIAKELLKREINRAKNYVISEKEVREIYASTQDKRIIIFDKELEWQGPLMKYPEPIFAVYPRMDGAWSVRGIPASTRVYGKRRKDLPTSWAGKEAGDLQSVTGVKDAVFAHRGLFMAVAKSKEGAIELAKRALEA